MKNIIVFAAIFFAIGCQKEGNWEMPHPAEKITAFTLKEVHGGLLRWELQGESALEKGDTIVIYQFILKFYKNDGTVASILRADSGYISKETNDLKALGNVIVVSNDSTTLWTDELNWIEEKQKIETESFIKYKKGEKFYTGEGLEADPDLNLIVVKKKFHGKGEFE